ncbi:AT5G1 synthase, partial [Atrichornis clamosus]|nr:AT5G1 synthase [Atrichornis clamosus]
LILHSPSRLCFPQFRCCSRALARPASVSVFSRPEAQTAQAAAASPPQLLRRDFQSSAVSRDIDTAAKFIGARHPSGGSPSHQGFPLPVLCSPLPPSRRNPSLKQQLFSYAILGF